jgi:hypothetical protein
VKLKTVREILTQEPMPNSKNDHKCVYFLIKDDEIIYVGQTSDLSQRLVSHKNKEYDRFNYIEVSYEHADVVESVYIHLIRPKSNGKISNHRSKIKVDQMHAPVSADAMAEMLMDYVDMKEAFVSMARTLGYRRW